MTTELLASQLGWSNEIELLTADISQTADYLRHNRVAFGRLPDNRLVVPPREANGAILIFAGV